MPRTKEAASIKAWRYEQLINDLAVGDKPDSELATESLSNFLGGVCAACAFPSAERFGMGHDFMVIYRLVTMDHAFS